MAPLDERGPIESIATSAKQFNSQFLEGEMLLHNPFTRPNAVSIGLQLWDRAPLNLRNGSIVYIEPPRRPIVGRPIEVFVSPFAPDIWGDLWHLEISFRERVGLVSSLFELLRKVNVHPIASETCTFAAGEYHKAVIVCDCREYTSELDGSHCTRSSRELAELQGLRALIAAEFLEDLVFTNGLEPHLRLVRNAGHFRAYKRVQMRRREPQPATIEHGSIPLPKAVLDHIREASTTTLADMRCLVTSDSSDRCIRLFLSDGCSRVLHVHCVYPVRSPLASVLLFEFQQRNFDVLGSRLRQGVSEDLTGTRLGATELDLFLRPPSSLQEHSNSQLSHILRLIAADLSKKSGEQITLELVTARNADGSGNSKSNSNQTLAADISSN